jgi:hypothetical protein
MTFVLAGIALLVLVIILEGRRQQKRYGRGGGRGASLARTGMLELQRHLEPDRKVEIVLEKRTKTRQDASGEGAAGGDR